MDIRKILLIFRFAIFSIVFLNLLSINNYFCRDLPASQNRKGDRIDGNFKFLPIPYINYNRSFGYQIGALPILMFNPVKTDTISPSSMAGMTAIYSENKTWFLMGFSKLYFDEDLWRIIIVGGAGTVNFQFFMDSPIDSWIPYNTKMEMIFLQVQRRIIANLFGGFSLIHINKETTSDDFPLDSETSLNGLGLQLSMDERSSVTYPKSGHETKVRYFVYPEFLDNKSSSSKLEMTLNHYLSLRDYNDVLANRLFIGMGLGDLAFDQQLIVGRNDLRGYTQGAFRGNYLIALQSEYRWNFMDRLGMVGFLGCATVFEAINEDDNGKLLPSIGAGFRYIVLTETNMNVGIDIAAGKDDWGMYFRIGEAF